jgi:hypothetical protein
MKISAAMRTKSYIIKRKIAVGDKLMKTNTTTLTTIELTEKEEHIIHLGLGALAALFKTMNDNNNIKNPFHVKVTLDEIVKLEEKLLLKLMEENKAFLSA